MFFETNADATHSYLRPMFLRRILIWDQCSCYTTLFQTSVAATQRNLSQCSPVTMFPAKQSYFYLRPMFLATQSYMSQMCLRHIVIWDQCSCETKLYETNIPAKQSYFNLRPMFPATQGYMRQMCQRRKVIWDQCSPRHKVIWDKCANDAK